MPPALYSHCGIKSIMDRVLLTQCPVVMVVQTSVVGADKVTYGELLFENLFSGLKLTPSLSQKTDQGHTLKPYDHTPQSSPGTSYSSYLLTQSKNPFLLAASWQMTLPKSGSIFCGQTDYWLKLTSGSYTHGPNSVLWPQRIMCLVITPLIQGIVSQPLSQYFFR